MPLAARLDAVEAFVLRCIFRKYLLGKPKGKYKYELSMNAKPNSNELERRATGVRCFRAQRAWEMCTVLPSQRKRLS